MNGERPHYLRAEDPGDEQERKAKRAVRNMIFGALWFLGGIVVTLATINSDSSTYVIAWGAIVGGAIQFIAGAIQHSRHSLS